MLKKPSKMHIPRELGAVSSTGNIFPFSMSIWTLTGRRIQYNTQENLTNADLI